MICKVSLDENVYYIDAWTVGDERDVLLEFSNVAIDLKFKDKVAWLFERLTKIEAKEFSTNQMLYMLLQISAQINMPIREYTVVCPNCETINPVVINPIEACKYSDDEYEIEGYPIEDITQEMADEFSLETHRDYQELKTIYEAEQIRLEEECNCFACNHKIHIAVNAVDILHENIITLDIKYYYDLVFVLVSFGFSVSDINKMLPYELEMYKRKVEEYHEKQKKTNELM